MPPLQSHTSTNIPGAVMNAVLPFGKLNICHANAQSLCARKSTKLDEVKDLLHNSKVSVACFTESWFSTKNSNRSVAIPGFCVVRNDRTYRRGGGIVVYYREHLSCTTIFSTQLSSDSEDKTECLALELRLGGDKILVMTVYNPPENDCSRFLADKMTDFATRYNNVLLIGDFNTDLSKPSRKRVQFESMLESFGMSSVGEEPTFFHRDGCSQLDLLITSCRDKVLRFNQVGFPGLSQHDLIFGSLDFDASLTSRVDTYRDYINFNSRVLRDAILSVPWSAFYATRDPNELVSFFNTHVKQIHDECIPIRTSKNQKSSNLWFTSEIRKLMLERDLAYQDWIRAPRASKDQARRRYNVLRNRTNTMVANAKTSYLNRFLDSRTPPSVLWKRLKGIGVGKDKSSTACNFHPDDVNRTFLSSYIPSNHNRPRRSLTPDSPHSFRFRPVQCWEVVNVVCSIKSNATGLDGLPIKFIKIILPLVVQQITHMFNCIIETSSYPTSWKHAKILPLRKKPHLNTLSNLRPISILCALSKAFEKLLEQQMSSFIAENNLLTECQAGFRKGQSIQTAAVRVYDDLASTIDKKGSAILLLLDFSKAFDTIPHRKLCSKLETQFNFAGSAVNLIESYLMDRTQTVFCGDQKSEMGFSTSGVPQGSVLGPLLFCCHVNDLPSVLRYCSIQLYADDVQLYIRRLGPCSRELVWMVNEDLKRILQWTQQNQLFVNQLKSKAMFVQGRRRSLVQSNLLPPITLDGQTIEWTDKAMNLGFMFQADLQWDGLVNQQCGKVYASLRSLYSSASAAPVATRLKLFKALILPHFVFGELLHVRPSASAMDRIRVALNCCVRFVYGLNRYDHVSHLQKNLLGCPLESFYAYRSCMFLRKLIKTHSPPALFQKLLPFQGRRLQNLIIPPNNSTSYSSSLFVRGVVNYNSLPPTVKRSTSEAVFKRGCLEHWNRS